MWPFRRRPSGRTPQDLVDWSIEEYRHVPCGNCGGTQKELQADVDDNGVAVVVIGCLHCRTGNRWSGVVDDECL